MVPLPLTWPNRCEVFVPHYLSTQNEVAYRTNEVPQPATMTEVSSVPIAMGIHQHLMIFIQDVDLVIQELKLRDTNTAFVSEEFPSAAGNFVDEFVCEFKAISLGG